MQISTVIIHSSAVYKRLTATTFERDSQSSIIVAQWPAGHNLLHVRPALF